MEDDRKLVLQGVMLQSEFDQEWYLSPEAAIKGAIYGTEMAALRTKGQITRVQHEPALPVDTDWDIGVGDSTTIWFTQSLRSGEVRVIDYYECSGEGIQHYAQVLKGDRPLTGEESERAKHREANDRRRGYTYGKHWGPHDIAVTEFGTGKTRIETAAGFGIKFEVTPRLSRGAAGQEVEEGINAVKLFLARCWFDEKNTEDGREALTHYRREFNERLQEFKATPVHDWASHGADAFRGLAVRHQVPVEKRRQAAANMPSTWAWA
jgi:hypothetical protein